MATDSLMPSVVPASAQLTEEGFDVDSLLMSADLLATAGTTETDDLLAGLLDGTDSVSVLMLSISLTCLMFP